MHPQSQVLLEWVSLLKGDFLLSTSVSPALSSQHMLHGLGRPPPTPLHSSVLLPDVASSAVPPCNFTQRSNVMMTHRLPHSFSRCVCVCVCTHTQVLFRLSSTSHPHDSSFPPTLLPLPSLISQVKNLDYIPSHLSSYLITHTHTHRDFCPCFIKMEY